MRSFKHLCAATVICAFFAAGGASAQPVLITAAKTISAGDTTIIPTAGGMAVPLETAQITVNNTVLTVNGRYVIASLTLTGTAAVRHSPAFSYDADPGIGVEVVNGLHLIVTGDVNIASSAQIDASALGLASGQGLGAGANGTPSNTLGGGGGYGGNGQVIGTASGGGTYGSIFAPADFGSGGGSFYNGGNPINGGVGGGSIRLQIAGSLSVAGVIRSNGGGAAGNGAGGGAGGSVWITAGLLAGTGTIEANGSGFNYQGGGGRVSVTAGSSSFTGATRAIPGANAAGPGSVYTALGTQTPMLAYSGSGITDLAEPLTLTGNLVVLNGAFLSHRAGSPQGLKLDVSGNATFEVGSGIDLSGRGYGPGAGPGAGANGTPESTLGAGGSYGGSGRIAGATPTGVTYGNFAAPVDLGSGGGSYYNSGNPVNGGSGGGAARLIVGGTLTVNGIARANGGSAAGDAAGGGAGGSLWITAGSLAGTGTIEAIGGTYNYQAGGGRVSVVAGSSSFTGTSRAIGGLLAGPGSVYTAFGIQPATLLYAGAGITEISGPLSLTGNLITRNGAFLSHRAGLTQGLKLDVSGNATFEVGSGIDLSGRGYGPGEGPGAGTSGSAVSTVGAGGGYGGTGRTARLNAGGMPYGLAARPMDLGSGGGFYVPSVAFAGGSGGGLLELRVNGTLRVDGTVRSNGSSGDGNAGAGSGGGIYISTGSLIGAGVVEANGGTGGYQGGGGRVAIYRCPPSVNTITVRALSGGLTSTIGTTVIGQSGGTIEPISIACLGYNSTLHARIGGVGALSYQWRRSGVNVVDGVQSSGTIITGAMTADLTFTNITLAERGVYDVVVTTACGVYTSPPLNFTVSGERCQPADVAWDNGDILPPMGPCTLGNTNTGVNEGDYNAFFNTFFTNQAINSAADIAYDSGEPLPPFGPSGGARVNNGVNEGDYNCFFNNFFNGCPV
ncbi:hypothetical protein BH11PLA1_BH11PLA1_23630 [soil metagenome]